MLRVPSRKGSFMYFQKRGFMFLLAAQDVGAKQKKTLS